MSNVRHRRHKAKSTTKDQILRLVLPLPTLVVFAVLAVFVGFRLKAAPKEAPADTPIAKPSDPVLTPSVTTQPAVSTPSGPPAERAENYSDALVRAKATGKDIVVFQRGSDWNRLGELLYNDVWLK